LKEPEIPNWKKTLKRVSKRLGWQPPLLNPNARHRGKVKFPNPGQRFSAILDLADQLDGAPNAQHALMALCRMVASSLGYGHMDLALADSEFRLNPLSDFKSLVRRLQIRQEEGRGQRAWLGWDAVVVAPWEPTRLAGSLNRLSCGPAGPAEGQDPWLYDVTNHRVILWLPMHVVEAFNGLHSISAGMLSRTGTLPVELVYDLSPAYDVFTATAEEWRRIDTEEVFQVADWRTALLFELGRRMISYPPFETAHLRNKNKSSKLGAFGIRCERVLADSRHSTGRPFSTT
jgi:hypothetical protein